VGEHHLAAADVEVAKFRLDDRNAEIGGCGSEGIRQDRIGLRRCGLRRLPPGDKDRTGFSALVQPVLEPGEGHKGQFGQGLAGPHAESAQAFRRDHVAHGESRPLDGLVFSAEGTVGGNGRDSGQSEQDLLAAPVDAQFLGQDAVEHDLALFDGSYGSPGPQLGEAIIAADQRHPVCPQGRIAVGIFEADLENDCRDGCGEVPAEELKVFGLVGKPGIEELLGYESLVDVFQAIEGKIAKASLHGIADEECPGEDGRCRHHAEADRHIGPAVVDE